jgi:hypothetical protein
MVCPKDNLICEATLMVLGYANTEAHALRCMTLGMACRQIGRDAARGWVEEETYGEDR